VLCSLFYGNGKKPIFCQVGRKFGTTTHTLERASTVQQLQTQKMVIRLKGWSKKSINNFF
jgi:hypothetical protein